MGGTMGTTGGNEALPRPLPPSWDKVMIAASIAVSLLGAFTSTQLYVFSLCESLSLRLDTDNLALQDVPGTGFRLLFPRTCMDLAGQSDFWLLLHLEPTFCCNVGMRA